VILSLRENQSFVPDTFGLYGQVTKRARWMPRQSEAKKDVVTCDKVRGAGKQALILTFLNGETHSIYRVSHSEYIAMRRRTRGTETSKYPEEKKSTEIP
jgi:hypothetical protein